MSRTRNVRDKNLPNTHSNCVTTAREESKQGGIKSARNRKEWEAEQTFVVIKVDPKTTIYRPVSRVKNLKGQILHKGRI